MQLKGAEGIARVFYCTLVGRRIIMLHDFVKKSTKTPPHELKTAETRMKKIELTCPERPQSENKKLLVSAHYTPEVVEYSKSTGEGWQSRMDSVLRNYVTRQARRA